MLYLQRFDIMSLQEFKSYVANSGVDFNGLTDDKKESGERHSTKAEVNYIPISYFHTSERLSINICACQFNIAAVT